MPEISDKGAASTTAKAASAPAFGPPAAPDEVGTLGQYRILKQLGRGGMGIVYLALDTRLKRKIALKVMLPKYATNPTIKERFLREAQSAAQITHDNVITVYDVDERDGHLYIAMQFLQGYPLDQYLKKGTVSTPQIVRIARETAAGLAAAHRIGVVHRDVKPANLWLEAPDGRVKLLDFGLVQQLGADADSAQQGKVVGTPAYLSPEQARGQKVDHRTDLFSLGAVVYQLCSGRLPFPGDSALAIMRALATEEPQPILNLNPHLPESLASLIHQLLAKNPDHRPQNTYDVVKRLDAIEDELAARESAPAGASQLSNPQVAFAPISVAAQPDFNAFANLNAEDLPPDESEDEKSGVKKAKKALPAQQSGGTMIWIAAGVAVLCLAVALVAGIVIMNRKKANPEPKGDPPAPVKPAPKQQGTDPGTGTPAKSADASPDRKAAEYVLSVGGIVRVNDQNDDIFGAADLPGGPFTLTRVSLADNAQATDAGLAPLLECSGLKYLDVRKTNISPKMLNELAAALPQCRIVRTVTVVVTKSEADRKAAEYVLSVGGSVQVSGASGSLKAAEELPKATFALLAIKLDGTSQVTDSGLAVFKDCKNLSLLDLTGAGVGDEGLAHFKGCKNLLRVQLTRCRVTDVGLEAFKDCKDLQHVDLGNTAVTDAGLAQFRDYKKLTWLNVANTQVTDAGLTPLMECAELTHLDVRGARTTLKGTMALTKVLPKCQVLRLTKKTKN